MIANYKNEERNSSKNINFFRNCCDENNGDDEDIIKTFLFNTSQIDQFYWEDLSKICDEMPILSVDKISSYNIIKNAIETFFKRNMAIQYYIIKVIFYVFQVTDDVCYVFEGLKMEKIIIDVMLNTEIANDASLQTLLIEILNIYLENIDESSVEITWTNDLIKQIHLLIQKFLAEKDSLLSSYLSLYNRMLEKSKYSSEDAKSWINFNLYILNFFVSSEWIDIINTQYVFKNFEILLKKFPELYDEFKNSNLFQNLSYFLSKESQLLIDSLCKIIYPTLQETAEYFVGEGIITNLLSILNNTNKTSAYNITNVLRMICYYSYEGSKQVVEKGFLQCFNTFQYGFEVQKNLLGIIENIIEKNDSIYDCKTLKLIFLIISNFLDSDDYQCITISLKILNSIVSKSIYVDPDILRKVKDISLGLELDYDHSLAYLADSILQHTNINCS